MLTAAFRAFGGEELVRDFLNSLPGGFWSQFIIVMAVIFILGFFMSLGKAAVYKHIPVYYPSHVGAVGGLVGMIGGLGGFVLPIMFGVMNDLTGVWTSCCVPSSKSK